MAEEVPVKRSIEIHGTVQLEATEVEKRLKTLEEKLKGKGWKEWSLDLTKAVLPGVVLAVIGWVLNDTVNHALRERELQLEAAKEMEKLAPDFQRTDLLRTDAQAKAAQLAPFGRYSVPFFINILEVGNQNAQEGAEDGLRMVARSEPETVCSTLIAVISNKSGLYRWQTHLAALKILSDVACVKAQKDVGNYCATITSLSNFQHWVSAPIPEQSEYEKVNKQASQTLDTLNLASQNAK
jgi:hypothetical protein